MAVKTKDKAALKIADENATKKFDVTYMTVAIIAMIVVLVVAVTAYFRSSYVMYSPDKVATQYVNNIATMDEYDAMKYTIMIKNEKLGDFIYDNYMEKYAAKDGEKAPEMTAEEEGARLSEILNTMYPIFTDLIEVYGFSDYDSLLTDYFAVYAEEFSRIYGHEIITRDDMFAAFEGNSATYVEAFQYDYETAYGNGEEYAEKYLGTGKASLSDDDIYSPGYLIKVDIKSETEYTDEQTAEYINNIKADAEKSADYERFGISPDEIKSVCTIVAVKQIESKVGSEMITEKNAEFSEYPIQLTLVQIGSQWYVDIAE